MFSDLYSYDIKADPSGRKYKIAESLGEEVRMAAIIRWTDGRQKFVVRPHYVSDGAAFISDILKSLSDEGHCAPQETKLAKARKQEPSKWRLPSQIFRYVKNYSFKAPVWKAKQDAFPPQEFATLRFSKDQYRELVKKASAADANPYSLLFSFLQKAVGQLLLAENSRQMWLLPVNMRPALHIAEMKGNVTSSMNLLLSGQNSAKEINSKVMTMSRRGAHFGAWFFSNLSNYVGDNKLKQIILKDKSHYIGVFSNIGNFVKNAGFEIVPMVPCTRFAPMTASFMVTAGVAHLSLQLHTKLGIRTSVFARHLKSVIESELGSALSPSVETMDPIALLAMAQPL